MNTSQVLPAFPMLHTWQEMEKEEKSKGKRGTYAKPAKM